jgi:uncharacterized protein
MRAGMLSLLLIVISRMLLWRDRLNGRWRSVLGVFSLVNERVIVSSGRRILSAVYVSAGGDAPAVLICHGIGERVEYWSLVQGQLRETGVSSLVFNYSGYGASSGTVSAAHCEEDARSAYKELADRGHRSIILLGFSMVSGIACAVASQVDLDGLILREGFSSLREAGVAAGFPSWMTHLVPNVWDTVHRVGELKMPVLIVHSDADKLFPLSMPKRVAGACGSRGTLLVINGLSHDAPILAPTATYWQPIADWVKQRSSEGISRRSKISESVGAE